MCDGWEIKERLDHVVDAVIDSGECGETPTTVIDYSSGEVVIARRGAGDPQPLRVARPRPRLRLGQRRFLVRGLGPGLLRLHDPVGSSSVGLNFCPLNSKSFVFFSTVVPVVSPCEVFQFTLSPLLSPMRRAYEALRDSSGASVRLRCSIPIAPYG